MRLAYTPAQAAFRDEVHDYFTRVLTPELRLELDRDDPDSPTYREFVRQLGRDGWLCPTWPTEYGGRGLTPVEQFIFFDETQALRVPMPFLTTNTVGPTIQAFGTPEQQQAYLPRILAGDCLFSIGYSEPGAGTDLASLTTRAVRDGDMYLINGQKMWTSIVHRADYIWLAARTDPEAKKHEGISVLIVPTTADGFSWNRMDTIGGGLTSVTYYEDVRVPLDSCVGGENNGWRLMTTQLNQERIALSSSGVIRRRLDDVVRWAQNEKLSDGRRVIDQDWVQRSLAQITAQLAYLRLLNWKVSWEASQGSIAPADASTMKVYGSQFYIEAYRALMEVVGSASTMTAAAPGALLDGELEEEMRRSIILTFGGGTNEVQRDIIATLGLGMPRPPR